MPKRFYNLAFELGVTPRQFMKELTQHGLSVGNQMVVIQDALEERIREIHRASRAPKGRAPEPATALPVEEAAPPVEEAGLPAIEEAVPHEAPVAEGTETIPEPVAPAAAEVAAPSAQAAEPQATIAQGPSAPTAAGPAPASPTATAGSPAAPTAGTPAAPGTTDQRRRPRRLPGDAPPPSASTLVPTLDPRAGRLVKDAPRQGVPGVTAPPRGRPIPTDPTSLNPVIPSQQRAPGARRDSGRRGAMPEDFRGKQGKETFHLRKPARGKSRAEPVVQRPKSLEVEPPISVKKFSELSGLKAADVVRTMFLNHKMVVTPSSMLDQDALELLALEFELDVKFTKTATAEDLLLERVKKADAPEALTSRPPVVTILGHVDHGKTSLLDKVRQTDIAAKESGGITQHIGASQVKLPDGRRVTFIDTPGHEAFTEMRARGAKVTDVVVLVVAGDDGVMPQTVEAISHARAANVPIVVAITKCDKPQADTRRVRQQLSEHGVFVEGYGGDVSCFEVSAVTGKGIPELLEHLALLAEVEAERFRANPERQAEATVIEAANSPKRGVVATVLVQNGTLHKGDPILAGEAYGTVRAMFDYLGRQVKEAGPGDPVEVTGLDQAPEVGARLYAIDDTNAAREMADERRQRSRTKELAAQSKPTTVESLFGAIEEGKIDELRVVLKADVRGSLEPIRVLLDRMGTAEVRTKVLHAGVGAINESDVILASASKAWVIGFNVNVDEKARAKAKMLGVQITSYKIVYEIEDAVRAALEGKLAPEIRETLQGHVDVLKTFASSRLGTIAGCKVRDGLIRRDSWMRVRRKGQVVFEGRVSSLRREKDEARDVKEGLECGLRAEGWDAWQEGDEIEAFAREEIARKLA